MLQFRRCIDDVEDNEQDINNENNDIYDNDSNNSENYDKCEESGNSSEGDVAVDTSDLDNFVTATHGPDLINEHDCHNIEHDYIPTTHVGEEAFEVIEEIPKFHYVSGRIILNQYGSIYSQARHHIKSCTSQKIILQRMYLHQKVIRSLFYTQF